MPEARGGPLPFTLTGTICRQSLARSWTMLGRAFLNRWGRGGGGAERGRLEGTRVSGSCRGLSKALNSSQVCRERQNNVARECEPGSRASSKVAGAHLRASRVPPLCLVLHMHTCRTVVRSVNSWDKRGFECLNDDGNISRGNVCGETDFPRL